VFGIQGECVATDKRNITVVGLNAYGQLILEKQMLICQCDKQVWSINLFNQW